MFVRWNLIVCSETQSSRLIAAVVSPEATADRIERSRSVRAGVGARQELPGRRGHEAGAWKTAPMDVWRRTEAMSTVWALLST